MSSRIFIKPEAQLDITETAEWYEKQREGLGIEFLEALDITFSILKENPDLYQVQHKETHQALVDRFPFAVHYLPEGNTVYVLAVLHTKRNPQIWKKRS